MIVIELLLILVTDNRDDIEELARSFAEDARSEAVDSDQGDFDPLEIVFLDCYDYLMSMPEAVLKDPVTKSTLVKLRMHAELPCSCYENKRLGTFYILKQGITLGESCYYEEIPVCNVCATEIVNAMSEATTKFPLNSLVTFMSNVGRIYSFHKFVLII